jgi:hypothetical protein
VGALALRKGTLLLGRTTVSLAVYHGFVGLAEPLDHSDKPSQRDLKFAEHLAQLAPCRYLAKCFRTGWHISRLASEGVDFPLS